jgi:6-pyruvoyltetrahydropterin/6-carboxytetrahydropterin synthase
MIYITRRETFNAAHRLYKPEWSDEQNREVFGKCSNPNWHGHNYVLYVTLKGEVDTSTGFLVNLKELSALIKNRIIDKIDHRNMNLEVDFMNDCIPSTENLCIRIWNELDEPVRQLGALLHCVKVAETENNFAEYYGENKF